MFKNPVEGNTIGGLIGDKDENLMLKVHIRNAKVGNIQYSDCYVADSRLSPDAFLYCTCSKLIDMDIVQDNFHKNYNSIYGIKKIKSLNKYLSKKIHSALSIEYIHKRAHDIIKSKMDESGISNFNHFKNKELEIISRSNKIFYLKDHRIVTDHFDFWDKVDISLFSKKRKFQFQHEYRSAFFIYHRKSNSYFDVANKRLIINTLGIDKYVFLPN